MGLILDSSVLIASERQGRTARQVLMDIAAKFPCEDIALSVVTVIELMHGVVRAAAPARESLRRQFLNELLAAVPVYPVTVPIALRSGQLDGVYAAIGNRLALADLLIGVTALEAGYSVLTSNVRHFERIEHLHVIQL